MTSSSPTGSVLSKALSTVIDESIHSFLTKVSDKYNISHDDLLIMWHKHNSTDETASSNSENTNNEKLKSSPTTTTAATITATTSTTPTTSTTTPTKAIQEGDEETPLEIPDEFQCPILGTLMIDPVVTSDGHTYERNAILHWLKDHDTSPKTMSKLEHTNVVPNHIIRAQIIDFRQAHDLPDEEIWKPPEQTATDVQHGHHHHGHHHHGHGHGGGRQINIQINRSASGGGGGSGGSSGGSTSGPWSEHQRQHARNLLAHILQTSPHLVMDTGINAHRARGASWLACADAVLSTPRLFRMLSSEFRNYEVGKQLMIAIDERNEAARVERERQEMARESPWRRALRNDDAGALESMIVRGGSRPHDLGNRPDGQNMLHMAARLGSERCVTMFLARFFTNSTRSGEDAANRGMAAKDATENGTEDAMEEERKRSINAKDANGSTALHLASFFGKTAVVRILLAANAHVDAKMAQGDTPLIQACWNGHLSVVDELLSKGAKVNMTKHDGCTPLHLAVVRHQHETVKRLVTNGTHEMDVPDRTWTHCVNMAGDNPLHLAASAGCTHAAEILLLEDDGSVKTEATRMINQRNQAGMAPIHVAAYHGHTDVVKILIECVYNGIHPGSIDSHGNLVEVDVVSLGPDYPAASNDVALHIAAERGFVETCRLLLDAGSDVNQSQRNTLMTPLHYASKMRFPVHRDIVLLLGKHGAKETLNAQGLTPLCVACSSSIQQGGGGRGGRGRGGGGDAESSAAAAAAAEAFIRALLEIGGEVNPTTTRDGVTPLMRACCVAPIVSPAAPNSDAMLPIVRVLLDAGADVNAATTTSQNTALHLAASRGSIGICQLLMERGAKKAATDLGGTNPAGVARRNHHLREATFIEGYDGGGM